MMETEYIMGVTKMNMIVAPLGILLLLLIIAGVIGAIVLLVKASPATRKIVLGSFAVLFFVFIALGVLFSPKVHSPSQYREDVARQEALLTQKAVERATVSPSPMGTDDTGMDSIVEREVNQDMAVTIMRIIPLGMLVILIIGVIILLTKANPATRRVVLTSIAGLFVVSIAVVVVSLFSISRVTQSPAPLKYDIPDPIAVESTSTTLVPADNANKVSSAWLPEVEEKYEADNYASAVSATKALSKKVVVVMEAMMGEEFKPKLIQVTSNITSQYDKNADNTAIANAMAQALNEIYPEAKTLVEAASTNSKPLNADAVIITIRPIGVSTMDKNYGNFHTEQRTVTLNAKLLTTKGNTSTSIQYIDKPWVDNYSGYVSARPNQLFIKGQSSSFANSREEAYQQAVNDAANQIMQYAIGQPIVVGRTHYINEEPIKQIHPTLKQQIIRDVQSGWGGTCDRFAQRIEAHGGQLWRETILLKLNKNALNDMANQYVATVTNQKVIMQRNWLSRIGSVVGLSIFLLLVYWVLDNWTKGYYKGTIIAVIVLLALAGVAASLVMA